MRSVKKANLSTFVFLNYSYRIDKRKAREKMGPCMETRGRSQCRHRKHNETWLIFEQAMHPFKISFMNYKSYSLNIINIKTLNGVFLV